MQNCLRNSSFVVQAMLQARWPDDDAALSLPAVSNAAARSLTKRGYQCLGDIVHALHSSRVQLAQHFNAALQSREATDECLALLERMPSVAISASLPQKQAPPAAPRHDDAAQQATGVAHDATEHSAEAQALAAQGEAIDALQQAVEVTLQRHSGAGTGGGRGKGGSRKGGRVGAPGQRARVHAPRCAFRPRTLLTIPAAEWCILRHRLRALVDHTFGPAAHTRRRNSEGLLPQHTVISR